MVFAIISTSPEKLLKPKLPQSLTPLAFLSLDITSSACSGLRNDLQVREPVPSYKSKETNILPLLNSFVSILDSSPYKATLPSSGEASDILINDSLILEFLPNIKKGLFIFPDFLSSLPLSPSLGTVGVVSLGIDGPVDLISFLIIDILFFSSST